MGLIVQKYGGTSVGSIERIEHISHNIIKTREQGHDVVVVVSAMSGETDRLIKMAKSFGDTPNHREYDTLVSTGEQVTIALLSISLSSKGYKAISFTGGQAQIITDSTHKKARIEYIDPSNIRKALSENHIAVVAGFQGIDNKGNITTLGRGGSDTTAVAIAAALEADECQIYTDVDGVYTTDPRVVPKARRLNTITFEEMLEMASLGAKVLQNRAVEFAGKYKVPLRVLSSFQDGPGTLITFEENNMEQPLVSGIAFNRSEAKLTIIGVPDTPGVAWQIINPVSEANIDIDMIIQNISSEGRTDFTFTVHRDDYKQTIEILNNVKEKLGARVVVGNNTIAKLSLIGVGMRSHAGIANTMFKTLANEGINIQMISTSEIKVSVVVDEKYLELGVRSLHEAFKLDNGTKEEFDPCPITTRMR